MKIFLLRHSETVESKKNIILWHLNGELSKDWIDNSVEIWKKLKELDYWFKFIISSPLKRAFDTSNLINKYLKLNIKTDDLLIERWAWIAEWISEAGIDWTQYESKKIAYRKHKNWESFFDVRKRVKIFLNKINEWAWPVLIISHSVFILMMIWLVSKFKISKSLKINIKDKLICIDLKNNKINYYDI